MGANFGDGTNLAPRPVVGTSGFHVVRAAETRATATEWVRVRPYRIAPSIVVINGLLLAAAYPTPRIAVVGAAYGLSFVYQLREAARARRVGVEEQSLFVSHLRQRRGARHARHGAAPREAGVRAARSAARITGERGARPWVRSSSSTTSPRCSSRCARCSPIAATSRSPRRRAARR